MKSYFAWVKNNVGKVALTVGLVLIVAAPFIIGPVLALRAKVPGLNKLNPPPAA